MAIDLDPSGITKFDEVMSGLQYKRSCELKRFADGLTEIVIPPDLDSSVIFDDWYQKGRIVRSMEKVITDLHLTGKGP